MSTKKKYTFNVFVTARGTQAWSQVAESADEAWRIIEGGGGECIGEELEVTGMDEAPGQLIDEEDIP